LEERTERKICDTRHGCEYIWIFKFYISDIHLNTIYRLFSTLILLIDDPQAL